MFKVQGDFRYQSGRGQEIFGGSGDHKAARAALEAADCVGTAIGDLMREQENEPARGGL